MIAGAVALPCVEAIADRAMVAPRYTSYPPATAFGPQTDRLAKADKGDLVRITGRVRQSSYEADGATRYTVDMVADGFAILAKVNGKPADEDAGE